MTKLDLINKLKNPEIHISKTGGIYRNPESIVASDKAQRDLKILAEILRRTK